jgi:hypothetical protein
MTARSVPADIKTVNAASLGRSGLARAPIEANRGEGDRRDAAEHEPGASELCGRARSNAEEKQPRAQNNVHPDFGHDREQGRNRRSHDRIGGGQPEAERPHPRLDEERDPEDCRTGLQQSGLAGSCGGDARREIGHVERSRRGIDEAHANQEQQRGGEVDRDVVQARFDAEGAGAVKDKAVGRGKQDFEEYEEIE